MKNSVLEYKGYHTKIEFDSDACVLRGKIEGINDYVDFESTDAQMIEKEFQNDVDDYLAFCEEVGKEPDKEYKGTFNVRIRPSLHRKLAMVAFKNGESLNQTVENAIQAYLNEGMQNEVVIKEAVSKLLNEYNRNYAGAVLNGITMGVSISGLPNRLNGTKNINMEYRQ